MAGCASASARQFDETAHAIDVDDGRMVGHGHEDAPVRLVRQEPVLGEEAERLAQRVARHGEIGGQSGFGQSLSGQEFARDHTVAQVRGDTRGQGRGRGGGQVGYGGQRARPPSGPRRSCRLNRPRMPVPVASSDPARPSVKPIRTASRRTRSAFPVRSCTRDGQKAPKPRSRCPSLAQIAEQDCKNR